MTSTPMALIPIAALRIARFDSVAVVRLREFDALKGFRNASAHIMGAVRDEILTSLKAVPHSAFRDLSPTRFGSV